MPSTPTAAIAVKAGNKNVACGGSVTLPLGTYTLSGSVSGFGQPYVVNYGGACNAAGKVTLTNTQPVTCIVSAEAQSIVWNAGCASGQRCCEPTAEGCKKCISANELCQ